jgi:hypothetical protein
MNCFFYDKITHHIFPPNKKLNLSYFDVTGE